jgi:two-component system sensor histidine kinase PilS (NtrC family)
MTTRLSMPFWMTADDTLGKRLTRLILIRLGAVLLLFGAVLAMDQLLQWKGQLVSRLNILVIITLITCGLTCLYTLLLHVWSAHRAQAYLQIAGDIVMITWLVALTGIIESPFTALYLIVIFMASSLFSRRGTLVMTAFTCACYGLMNYAAYRRWWPFDEGGLASAIPAHALGSAVGFNFFAFLAVAFLGSQLHERLSRTDEHLAQANRNLNDLRAFSERVIASISSGLVTTDLKHYIISFNRAAEEITGYKASEVLGQHLSQLIPNISDFLDCSLEALQSGHHLSRLNVECRTGDGRMIEIGISISPLTTTSGEITGFVLPFQDLTEVLELEREVRRHDRLAALGRVAAAIAHEIRNPLASMRGAVQVLGSEIALSEEQQQLMSIVLRESDRLDRIITDFLMYARPRRPEMERVDLNDLLEETLTLLRFSTELSSERHQLIAHPAAEAALVEADAGQIRQVFWNLSRNAITAMPDGGTLTISIARSSAPSDGHAEQIEVTFSDTGIGMNEEQVERVFEPFSSFSSGGTGLGMSIVYQIVNEHQGRISIRSAPGQGTAITLRMAALKQSMAIQAAA